MDKLLVHGGSRLSGKVNISGSKNASLPIMAAALLTDQPCIIRHVPDVSDTNYMLLIAVIEAGAAAPLHEVYSRRLLRPLALRQTYFPGRSAPLDPTPEPAVLRFQGRPLHIPLLMQSIRGIYGTAGDSLSFLRRILPRGFSSENTSAWNLNTLTPS